MSQSINSITNSPIVSFIRDCDYCASGLCTGHCTPPDVGHVRKGRPNPRKYHPAKFHICGNSKLIQFVKGGGGGERVTNTRLRKHVRGQ